MSLKKEASGRRSVQVEVEVPGTPEEVWQAIATGPGVSSWFVPTEIEEREGGAVTADFGPGMVSTSTITSWEAPHQYTKESSMGPNAPAMAVEWIVEARDGGTCVVRVVHSLFANTDDWDKQIESMESGWPDFFRILRLYLTHFRGQRCSALRAIAMFPVPVSQAWNTLSASLGLATATEGRRCTAAAGVPPLAGLVEQLREGKHSIALIRTDEPAPGAASVHAISMGAQVYVSITLYLYGDRAADVVARDEPLWNAWIQEHFPSAENAGPGCA